MAPDVVLKYLPSLIDLELSSYLYINIEIICK